MKGFMSLVEPDKTRMGWACVRWVVPLRHAEIIASTNDQKMVHVVNRGKSAAGTLTPITNSSEFLPSVSNEVDGRHSSELPTGPRIEREDWNLVMVFADAFRASNAMNLLLKSKSNSNDEKWQQIDELLEESVEGFLHVRTM
eukprot:TRINITY_DN4239_c0_g4_i1.p1 TRINITY_DN4239_c0_g4~~TRINITY_DN4239_c0_g4_i1.p1  ORF type:complete len:142 (+),score=33.05 TRINITY_DN4239_c0_g4_i1:214-639(+)